MPDTTELKVLHIVGGKLTGGAARGALYLSNALRELGVDSRISCSDLQPDLTNNGVVSVASELPGRVSSFARAKTDSLPMRLFPKRDGRLFSMGISGVDWKRRDEYNECNIVHLHWINRGMLSVEGIGKLDKPVVWTLRDMWPFTGGCHYSMSCQRYRDGCGKCPAIGSQRDNDPSTWVLKRKLARYPHDITYVGISNWMSDCARQSRLLEGRDVRTIPNSIDTQAFRKIPKQEARKRLGIPMDRPILLHGSLHLGDAYKGFNLLEEAKRRLDRSDIFTCTFGDIHDGAGISSDRHFGLVRDDELLRTIYSAADVLAFPSVQEAFGKVPAEAMACGTPAVVFAATGPGEIVTHKVTGYAAKPFSVADFAAGINWILSEPKRLEALGEAAEQDAHRRFNPNLAAKRYLDIYLEKVGQLA